jgi:hypothetical protein
MIMVNMGTSTTVLLRTHWLSTVTAGLEELLHSMWFLESNFWDSFGELWLVHVEKQVFSAQVWIFVKAIPFCNQLVPLHQQALQAWHRRVPSEACDRIQPSLRGDVSLEGRLGVAGQHCII